MGRLKPAVVLSCVLAGSVLAGCKAIDAINALEIENVQLGAVQNGTYEGHQDNAIVTAKVRVVVKDGRITGVEILEHNHGPGHGADAIVDVVLEKQSLMVDAVTGATYSSKVLLKAIELALREGL